MFIKRKKITGRLLIVLAIIVLGLSIFWFRPQTETKPITLESPVKYEDFHLEIPKLEINAPIILDVPGGDTDKDIYFKSLEKGVAHFAGTKKPGQGGLIFIFGHSSFYPWAAGDYKEIFSHLDELAVGDEIIIWFDKKEYKYKVTETKIVQPDDISVLKPTSFEQLTIMTCWPPGTTQKRMVIIAKPQ